MAINIHTDTKLEKCLEWLARYSDKTKTDVIKELVLERYHLKRSGFQFGSLKPPHKKPFKKRQKELKEIDQDHDLD